MTKINSANNSSSVWPNDEGANNKNQAKLNSPFASLTHKAPSLKGRVSEEAPNAPLINFQGIVRQ